MSFYHFILLFFFLQLNVSIALEISDLLKTNLTTKRIDNCNVSIPIIDISSLRMAINYRDKNSDVIQQIKKACTEIGFFYIKNHGVPDNIISYLEKLSRDFFSLPNEEKREISMDKGGSAWRGYFSVGEEVTSGIPDQKEGIYFGTQGNPDDDRPLHGINLYPNESMKDVVETYMEYMNQLGEMLMKAIVLSLGLDYSFVDINFQEPTELFRVFGYPPHDVRYGESSHAVGTHSDYGYLTILYQDRSGGLQVKPKGCAFKKDYWVDANPIDGTFVINLGDALEHFTGGYYTSTPHRVVQRINAENLRISMPYFYDPNFDTPMKSILHNLSDEIQKSVSERRRLGELSASQRWDNADPTLFQGTYGEYLKNKISKVFPHLYNAKIKSSGKDIKSRLLNLLNKDVIIEPKNNDDNDKDNDNDKNEYNNDNNNNDNNNDNTNNEIKMNERTTYDAEITNNGDTSINFDDENAVNTIESSNVIIDDDKSIEIIDNNMETDDNINDNDKVSNDSNDEKVIITNNEDNMIVDSTDENVTIENFDDMNVDNDDTNQKVIIDDNDENLIIENSRGNTLD